MFGGVFGDELLASYNAPYCALLILRFVTGLGRTFLFLERMHD